MKKMILMMSVSALLFACGGEDEKKDEKKGMTDAEKCECLNASINDRSDACHKYRAEVMKEIKAGLEDSSDLDAIDAELKKRMDACK
ncbi:MAG: hypothetical protein R2799_01170 [Crocinitomicaceae bacterium]